MLLDITRIAEADSKNSRIPYAYWNNPAQGAGPGSARNKEQGNEPSSGRCVASADSKPRASPPLENSGLSRYDLLYMADNNPDARRHGFQTEDSRVRSIADKVFAHERLSFDDAVALYRSSDILAMGWLANHVRERMH